MKLSLPLPHHGGVADDTSDDTCVPNVRCNAAACEICLLGIFTCVINPKIELRLYSSIGMCANHIFSAHIYV